MAEIYIEGEKKWWFRAGAAAVHALKKVRRNGFGATIANLRRRRFICLRTRDRGQNTTGRAQSRKNQTLKEQHAVFLGSGDRPVA